MKSTIIILAAFITCANLHAQNGWVWQNPYPCNDNFIQAKMIDNNTGFIVGHNNLVMKTTNGGTNWNVILSLGYPTYYLNDVDFVDNNRRMAVGYGPGAAGTILKTTDGGNIWFNLVTLPPGSNSGRLFTKFEAANGKLQARILSPSSSPLYSTSDFGNSWSIVSAPTYIEDFDFVNGNTGWCVGSNGMIYKTTNGGANWTPQSSGVSQTLWVCDFIDENTGWAAGLNFFLYTTNGGNTWAQIPLTGSIPDDIEAVDALVGFMSRSNQILKTTNGGNNWTVVHTGTSGTSYTLDKLNGSSMICVGNPTRQIIKTTNGGNTWTNLTAPISSETIRDITFVDQNTGVACGDNGSLRRTTNGGNSWTRMTYGMNILERVFKTPGLDLFMGGQSGTLYKSTNSGLSWIQQTIANITRNITDIKFLNNNTGFISVDTNKIYKTTNSGNNWYERMMDTQDKKVYEIEIVPPSGPVFGVGKLEVLVNDKLSPQSYVTKSTDAGETWSQVLGGTYPPLRAGYFLNANTGYVVGEMKTALKTTNGGASWQPLTVPGETYATFNSIHFVTAQKGYILDLYGLLNYTSDGGTTWTILYPPTNQVVRMFFRDSLNVYMVGGYETIIKSNTGGFPPIGIQQISSNIPESFVLGQNYPNPFNPSTKIRFSVPPLKGVRGMTVRLVIYDLLGREIETLVNEQLQPGTYETEWNGTAFSSGVYFYQLTANDFKVSRKMVLSK